MSESTTGTWHPSAGFAYLIQVQTCIRLWLDAGLGEVPDWLKDQLILAREAHRLESVARGWSKQVEAVE